MAQVLRPLREKFQPQAYPDLLVGLGAPDDAAVYRLNPTTAIIQTMDFFPPVVDDAYSFGAIAAANAMSDVYAMGGEVMLALNIAAWREDIPLEVLSDILRGAADKVAEGGAAIAGGHTITDDEPKFGLSVTGIVHPDRITTKGGARPGDYLVLTKPLGSGLITTAAKNGVASEAHLTSAIVWMTRLNRGAAHAMQRVGIRSATDVTGYGILGHAYEMAEASGVVFRFRAHELPLLDGALEYAEKKQIPGGSGRNRLYLNGKVDYLTHPAESLDELLYDPQTSGGLLIAVPEVHLQELVGALDSENAAHWIVGDVAAESPSGDPTASKKRARIQIV